MATKAGEYIGILKLGRQPLPGSPFHVFVRPDATHPDHCVVSAPSPTIGPRLCLQPSCVGLTPMPLLQAEGIGLEECTVFEESKITVKTYDIHGNRTAQKFDMMQILVKGGGLQGKGKKMKFRKAVVGGTVRSNQAGTFEITYAVPYAGAYSIEVTYGTNPDGPWAPIRDSPFQVLITASCAPRSSVCRAHWERRVKAERLHAPTR